MQTKLSTRARNARAAKVTRSRFSARGDGDLGGRAGRRPVNLPKVCLQVDLDREGDLVEHVGSLMDPTPLMPGAGKGLFDCLPEAERTVADREVGRDPSPRRLMSMRSSRQLCALSLTPVWKPTSSFLPSGVSPPWSAKGERRARLP
jgi:hypothetical protein